VGVGVAVDVVGGGGGAVADAAGGCGELHDVPLVAAEICGSSNLTASDCSLLPAAASTLAKAWKASPPLIAIGGHHLWVAWSKFLIPFLLCHL
jgi:hypothetical protein